MVCKCVCIFSTIVYSLSKEGASTGVRAQTLKADRLLAVSCLTLRDPVDCHGILQARILEWVAICFSRGSSWPRDWTHISCTAGRFSTAEPSGKPTWKLVPGFKCCPAVDYLGVFRQVAWLFCFSLQIWKTALSINALTYIKCLE